MGIKSKIIIIISGVLITTALIFGGYKFFFDNVENNNEQNNKASSKTKQDSISDKKEDKNENDDIINSKDNSDSKVENNSNKKTNSSNNKNSNRKNDESKKNESSSKNNENANNSTSNKTENNSEQKKKDVVCYPMSINTNSDENNQYNTWYNETNNVPYILSNYIYLLDDNSRVIGDTEKCTSFDNTLSWEFKQLYSECAPKTSISNNGSYFSVHSSCLGGFKVYIYNKLGDKIGIMNLSNRCRPVTSVRPQQTDFYVKANPSNPFNGRAEITISKFNYTGSENCTSYAISPSFEVTVNNPEIAYCNPNGGGIYVCGGKAVGQTTATVRIWNSTGGATTTINIISESSE